jgi:hypothetical protein
MKRNWLCFFLLLLIGAQAQAQDILPDITIWKDQLYDNAIDTNQIPGRTLLRLSNGTPNLGPGRLELRGSTVISSTEQQVNQRIYQVGGGFRDRLCGVFTYHAAHGHIHFDNWCTYRLRQVTEGNGVGAVVATGSKTSFCVLDLTVHDNTNPNFHSAYYGGCGAQVQGLTPGWADIYSRHLTDQWIDITGVPNGQYWLESEVDPDNMILESNETNNVERVLVTIGQTPPPQSDSYEPNDSKAQVDTRTPKVANSPYLGTVNALRVIENLSIHTTADKDFFRFRINNTGTSGDYVKIEPTTSANSDIDLRLRNASGTVIATSESSTNTETISLNGRAAGWYYIEVYSYSGTLPGYKLTIDPSANRAPTITLSSPNTDVWVEQGFETFPVNWIASDPDQDPTRVAFFRCTGNSNLNKSDGMIPGYEALPGTDGTANVNTGEMPVGKWYLYVRVTDGGANAGVYAPGRFLVYKKGDIDWDGHVGPKDYQAFMEEVEFWGDLDMAVMIYEAHHILDFDHDGDVDRRDLSEFRHHAFGG